MVGTLAKAVGRTEVYLAEGDITQIPADAIVTAINSGGMWFGGIDGAIQRTAGNQYHAQAEATMPLQDGQTVVAKGNRSKHGGKFNNVVFVIDDLEKPLDEIVYAGLKAAKDQGYETVLLPAIRMGVMSGAVERTPQETAAAFAMGIYNFAMDNPESAVRTITCVAYRSPETIKLWTDALKE